MKKQAVSIPVILCAVMVILYVVKVVLAIYFKEFGVDLIGTLLLVLNLVWVYALTKKEASKEKPNVSESLALFYCAVYQMIPPIIRTLVCVGLVSLPYVLVVYGARTGLDLAGKVYMVSAMWYIGFGLKMSYHVADAVVARKFGKNFREQMKETGIK